MNQILSLKITLNKTNPRHLAQGLGSFIRNLFDLHHIIQISMGWKNSHLFAFQVGNYRIGYIDPNEAFEDIADASEVVLDCC